MVGLEGADMVGLFPGILTPEQEQEVLIIAESEARATGRINDLPAPTDNPCESD